MNFKTKTRVLNDTGFLFFMHIGRLKRRQILYDFKMFYMPEENKNGLF